MEKNRNDIKKMLQRRLKWLWDWTLTIGIIGFVILAIAIGGGSSDGGSGPSSPSEYMDAYSR